MKASLFSFLSFILCVNGYHSQIVDFNPTDTLKYNYRTGGNLDTFDLTFAKPYTTFPATGFYSRTQLPSIDFFATSPSLFSFQVPKLITNKTVSALPHVGFFYSFGLKGTQALHTNYQQIFKKNTLFNLQIDRQSSAGYPVNSGFSQNIVTLGLYNTNNKLAYSLRAGFSGRESSLYSGNPESSAGTIDSLGLQFATVLKTDAQSIQKGVHAELELAYQALKDSSQIKFGPAAELNFNLWNRVYLENDANLSTIYSEINYDSLKTKDQFQDAKLASGAGFFLKFAKVNFTVLGTHRYWRFQNLGTNRDTNELGVKVKLNVNHKAIRLQSETRQNILGAQQEFISNNEFCLGDKSKNIGLYASYAHLLPDLVQRFYFANNLNFITPSLKKQQRLNLSIQGKIGFWKLETQTRLGIMSWTNNLSWQDTIWAITSNSDLKAFYFQSNNHLDLGKFHWYPSFTFQTGSEYLPEFVFSGRILFKSKVFKAKKLELMFALDPQFNSTYKFLSYNALLDNYNFDNSNRTGGQPYALHSTFGMGIEEFRFFVRAENVHTFWTKNDTELLQNYYRAPFLLRLGLSWDFFN